MKKVKTLFKKLNNHHILMMFIIAVFLYLVIETLGRLSPISA